MEFIAFGALQGDAFIVKNGNTNILIDGGMPKTAGQIITHVVDNSLSAVFITHVDYDHLGGIFGLIDEDDIDLSECDFFMNHPEFPCEYQGEEVGFKHGHSLKDSLDVRRKSFGSVVTDQDFFYGDIHIRALSPDAETIEALYQNWGNNIIYEDGILKYNKRQIQSGDIINKASLILLFSCNESNFLMLGDAHASTAQKSIQNLGHSIDNPLPLKLLKLSHHGSCHNTSKELIELIDCKDFYISTNGGSYDHPDKETIEILQQRAAELDTTFNIYLNYDIEADIRSRCNFALSNLNFIEQRSLEFM